MAKGTVKTFKREKGFGFIVCDDGTEVFFHQSAIQGDPGSVREGQAVEFDMGQGPKGKRAENVRLK